VRPIVPTFIPPSLTRRRLLSATATSALALAAEDPRSVKRALDEHKRAVWVKDVWVRDPYIVLAPDGFYYYTGTTQPPGQPEETYNTGLGPKSKVGWHVQAWRSPDLVQWQSLGTVYSLSEGYWATAEKAKFESTPKSEWRLWAPEFHWMDGRWAVIHTSPSPHRSSNFSLTAAAALKGPWTHPMAAAIGHRHDPSLFKDDDGTWWMIWGATEIAPLTKDFTAFAAPPVTIGPAGRFARMGHEGCLMRKIHGKYVLFGTGWSTGAMRKGSYNLYYAVADRITGPYSERNFAGRFLGHGTPFQDKRNRWWCTAFYNANVPPIPDAGIQARDLSADAQTINQQGLTLVPLDVSLEKGSLRIRAKDPRYASPGPDEAQKF
jgi:arylsulfatase